MRGLLTPVALILAVMVLSGPVSGTVLLAVPLGLLLVVSPGRPLFALAGAVLLGVVLTAPVPEADGLVRAERGWALLAGAWLLMVTAIAPRWGALRRALAATVGAAASAAVVLLSTGGWAPLEAALDRRLHRTMAAAGAFLRRGGGELATREAADAAFVGAARLQTLIFPAALALATLAALGLAAALHARNRQRQGFASLSEFRFGDGMVWVLIGGLAGTVLPLGEVVSRVGANMIAFMAGLYALRGIAVVVAIWAGAAPVVWVIGVVVAVLLYPFAVPATMMIGLGDTWLDLRARAKAARANEE
ncbi:MAG: hypothetical protein ABFS34_10410 [Gemmatimonadota bacterium]